MSVKTLAAAVSILFLAVPSRAGDFRYPLELTDPSSGAIFSANYKAYVNKPAARVTLVNNTDNTFDNVRVSFYLSRYMDFPSDTLVKSIEPRKKLQVALTAVFNNKVLELAEDSPVQAEYGVVYYADGEEKSMKLHAPAMLLARSAIGWDNAARLASFVTPNDPPIAAFCRGIKEISGGEDRIHPALATAAAAWAAMIQAGFTYTPGPASPCAGKRRDENLLPGKAVFPRETLRNRSGDCGDLTAFAASVFEGLGLKTALLDYEDHLTFMFDTGEEDRDFVDLPEAGLMKRGGTWWAPLEATRLGKKDSFPGALAEGASLYKVSREKEKLSVIEIEKAWLEFPPATLPETRDWDLNVDWGEARLKFRQFADSVEKTSYEREKEAYNSIVAEKPGDYRASVDFGIMLGRHGRLDEARSVFEKLLAAHPGDAAALADLGSVEFSLGRRHLENRAARYDRAKDLFMKAAKADPYDAGLYMNLARVHLELAKSGTEAAKRSDLESAKEFILKAMKLDPEGYNSAAGRQLLYQHGLE